MTKWAEVLDWFKEFQQVLEKKVAEEDAAQAAAVQTTPVAQTATQPTGVVLEERTAAMPQTTVQQAAAAQTAVPVDEAAERRKREGRTLAHTLKAYGMYNTDLANALDVSADTVSKWVTGKFRIDYVRIAKCQVLPQRFRLAVLSDVNNNIPITTGEPTKHCKICGKQFVAKCHSAAFCPGCELNNKKNQTAFFVAFPRAYEVLKQRYFGLSSILCSWVLQNAPAPCTKDLITKECGEKAGMKFGQAFNCKNVCGGSRATWCIGQECKYHRDGINKIPIGGTL